MTKLEELKKVKLEIISDLQEVIEECEKRRANCLNDNDIVSAAGMNGEIIGTQWAITLIKAKLII